jgi:[ribosomal protein S5]-alanine N-acetyltransferase
MRQLIGSRRTTRRLELFPLPPEAAAALPDDRVGAARIIGGKLAADWPASDLLGLLPMQAAAGPERARYGIWVIVERKAATVVGDIGFHGPPTSDGTIEIGYSIAPSHRRLGYATEAARALIAWARERPEVRSIIASCDENNEASIGTLERLGFSRTGQAEGQLRWRL